MKISCGPGPSPYDEKTNEYQRTVPGPVVVGFIQRKTMMEEYDIVVDHLT